jgi:penicillin-binding protein 2
MQILDSENYQVKSNENSIKKVTIDPPRGILFDRNFRILVSNKPSYTVEILPSEYDDKHNAVLETALKVNKGFVRNLLNDKKGYSKFIPRKIKRDVEFSTVSWIEENKNDLSGIDYKIEYQRDYSFGIYGSHVFGYIKEISPEQLKKESDIYSIGDYVGFSGIEKRYEKKLRGTEGAKYVLVDAKQKTVNQYLKGRNDVETVKGSDLVLTLDYDTQKKAEELFEGKKGALAAIEPATGEIIALVSAPYFELSDLGGVTTTDKWKQLTNDPDKPLFNRATMSIYPPGSTFKMVTAIAALEEGIITPDYTITCRGSFFYGDRTFKCDHVHGKTDLIKSIEESCNVYYYQLILKLGLDKWSEYASKFGFGSKTGYDLGEEIAGILPTTEYYDKKLGKGNWTKGLTINLSIGQGEISATPLQLAQYTATIAMKGVSSTPHLVKGMIDSHSNNFVPFEFPKSSNKISAETYDIVNEAMLRVVHGKGTATRIKIPGVKIAGKTGTAQNPFGKNHAVFIAYAPFENPQIAVAVIVENVGYGSSHAAPIARDIIKTYLRVHDNKITSKIALISNND